MAHLDSRPIGGQLPRDDPDLWTTTVRVDVLESSCRAPR
jgi:hypothetical protein